MLAPHHGEDAELDEIRLALEQPRDARILFERQAVLANDVRRNCGHANDWIRLSKRGRPVVEPSSGSHARSGWGIMPSTLRFSFRTPAMLRTAAFGVSS